MNQVLKLLMLLLLSLVCWWMCLFLFEVSNTPILLNCTDFSLEHVYSCIYLELDSKTVLDPMIVRARTVS